MKKYSWLGLISCAALAIALSINSQALAATGVGEAYGVNVNIGTTTIAKTPWVVLPPNGSRDPIQASLLSLNQPGVVSATTLYVVTQGILNGNNGTISSDATLQTLNVLNGIVTADLVDATSSSGQHTDQGNQNSARISTGGAAFSGLRVAGVPVGDSPGPNTTIPVAGVGTVILNEQIETGDNLTNASLRVNAVHVILMNGVTPVSDIIICSAFSGVDYRR